MARIKGLCEVLFVIAITVLVCTFIPSFYAEGVSKQEVYLHLQDELGKIADGTDMDRASLQGIMSEEEFIAQMSGDILKERIVPLIESSSNYQYVFTEEEMASAADEIVKVYEEELNVLKRPTLSSYIHKVRLGSGGLAVVSGLLIAVITLKKKK